MQTLVTNRLILRGWSHDDAGALLDIAGNPNVAAGAGLKPLKDRDGALDLIDRYIESGDVWAAEHKLHNKVIGVIGLSGDAIRPDAIKCRRLTVLLSEVFWGSGYAVEAARALMKHAFHSMDLDLVTAYHFPSDNRLKRALEKCGFTCAGTLRQAVRLWNGEVRDAVCWSILREEFKNLPATRSRKDAK